MTMTAVPPSSATLMNTTIAVMHGVRARPAVMPLRTGIERRSTAVQDHNHAEVRRLGADHCIIN